MNVLVLGGGGFIGSHIADALVNAGHDVTVFNRSKTAYINTSCSLVTADFTDSTALAKALTGIDTVIHCISTTVPSTSALDPVSDINSNLVGTVRLLQLMQKMEIRRLIYLSSGGTVYGPPSVTPVSEASPLNPISNYGAVKVAIEKFIGVAENEWGLLPTIIRPSNPYGERQFSKGAQGLIATLFQKFEKGEPITIYGNGEIIRDYIYVKDLADLICQIAGSDRTGIFNCGSGVGTSINSIINIVEETVGGEFQKIHKPKRPFDVKEIVLDCFKARKTFGWQGTTPLDVGIRSQFNFLKGLHK